MESFIIAFLHRVLSGVQNGLGYAKLTVGLCALGLILCLAPWAVENSHWLFFVFYVVNIITVSMKSISFDMDFAKSLRKYKDIHLWENLVTGGFFVWMMISGHNILMLCCSVYPALIFHKGAINLGSGLKFFANATDDATGKTYGIPILGIKVPRSGAKFRLIAAGLSLLAAGVILLMKWGLAFDLTNL